MIAQDQLIEYARYVNNYYGTPRAYVEQKLEEGKDVILEIEIQGALKVKEAFPDTLLLFVTPPSAEELKSRLLGRGTEEEAVVASRLSRAWQEAQGVEAYDYLVKPLAERPFQKTMKRALLSLRQHAKQNLLIQRGNSCQVILLSQILYCEVLGRKIYVHQTDGTVLDYYDRLEHLEQQTDGRFFRCHRSYLVNLDYVRGCQKGQVLLPEHMQIPVSRLREKELAQALCAI